MTFAERLKTTRQQKGLNQSQLGELVGVTNKAVSLWECGVTHPPKATMVKLAEALQVNYAWLNIGQGFPTVTAEAESKQKKIQESTYVYKASDKRKLEDIELCIKHIRDMNLSLDEKRAIHLTLSELRTDFENKVLFGIR